MDRGLTPEALKAHGDLMKLIEKKTVPSLSTADVAAHEAASYVRPSLRAVEVEVAYLEREQQLGRQVAAEIAGAAA